MIFKFRKDRFSDVVKVVAFLDKEGIEYEVTTDIEVALGGATTTAPVEAVAATTDNEPKMVPTVERVHATNPDPLWRIARHDNEVCNDFECKDNTHYGAVAVGS